MVAKQEVDCLMATDRQTQLTHAQSGSGLCCTFGANFQYTTKNNDTKEAYTLSSGQQIKAEIFENVQVVLR